MNHIVDAHVAYCNTISDLSRDKIELLKRIKRLEEDGDEAICPIEYATRVRIWTKAKEAKL